MKISASSMTDSIVTCFHTPESIRKATLPWTILVDVGTFDSLINTICDKKIPSAAREVIKMWYT